MLNSDWLIFVDEIVKGVHLELLSYVFVGEFSHCCCEGIHVIIKFIVVYLGNIKIIKLCGYSVTFLFPGEQLCIEELLLFAKIILAKVEIFLLKLKLLCTFRKFITHMGQVPFE